jgi:zinc protease
MRENLYLDRTFAYYADLERKVRGLTPAEVNQALDHHLSSGRLVIIRAGDFGKKGEAAPAK